VVGCVRVPVVRVAAALPETARARPPVCRVGVLTVSRSGSSSKRTCHYLLHQSHRPHRWHRPQNRCSRHSHPSHPHCPPQTTRCLPWSSEAARPEPE